jgi:transcriptional regulator with XRE-family HTH domain
MSNITLAEYFIHLRAESGLSQADFGERLGVSAGYLCDIEHGRRAFSIQKAILLSKRLRIDPKDILELTFQNILLRSDINYQISLTPMD